MPITSALQQMIEVTVPRKSKTIKDKTKRPTKSVLQQMIEITIYRGKVKLATTNQMTSNKCTTTSNGSHRAPRKCKTSKQTKKKCINDQQQVHYNK